MHELGVVLHIIDSVKELARENDAAHINAVTLEMGEVNAVVPSLLQGCWKWACERHEMMKGCELKLEGIKAITHCEDCGHNYPTIVFEKQCPYCNSTNTYLIQGQEFTIKDITIAV